MRNYQNHPLAGAVDLDSAFSKLWSFYKKYFIGLYIISVAGSLLSLIFMADIDMASLQDVSADPELMLDKMKSMAGPYALTMLVTLILMVVLHAWVLDRPADEPGFGSMLLKKMLMALVPYLVAMIIFMVLTVILTSIGIVLLVLPGLFALAYMATVMIFAMPVTLVETLNPLEIITRSFKLMHRNLWPNMGWFVILALIMVVTAMLLSTLTMLPFTGSFIRSITNPEEAAAMLEITKNPVYIGLSALTGALVRPLMPILAFLLYFRNRGEEVAESEITTDTNTTVRVEDLYPRMPEND
jgi:hypothetical protein